MLFCSLTKGITPNICWLCLVLINSVYVVVVVVVVVVAVVVVVVVVVVVFSNLFCVRILF